MIAAASSVERIERVKKMASRKLGFERLVTLCIDSKGAGEGASPKLHTLRLALMVGDSTPKVHRGNRCFSWPAWVIHIRVRRIILADMHTKAIAIAQVMQQQVGRGSEGTRNRNVCNEARRPVRVYGYPRNLDLSSESRKWHLESLGLSGL